MRSRILYGGPWVSLQSFRHIEVNISLMEGDGTYSISTSGMWATRAVSIINQYLLAEEKRAKSVYVPSASSPGL